uniref:Uncharacterized protein n=1 Tax=Arundo donax TaxID=35708 RepID=A0A0A8YMB6_ARUDO
MAGTKNVLGGSSSINKWSELASLRRWRRRKRRAAASPWRVERLILQLERWSTFFLVFGGGVGSDEATTVK